MAAHCCWARCADDARAGHVVAVLGGVADRVAHVAEAAAVHEVDDELQLVQALEVRDLGLVAGRRPASRSRPSPARSRRRRAPPARRRGPSRSPPRRSSRARRRAPRRWRLAYESACACALPVASWWTAMSAGTPLPASYVSRTRWPGPLGAIMLTSMSAARRDCAEANVEAVREHQRLARGEVRRDLVRVELRLRRVGREEHRRRRPRRRPRPPTRPSGPRPSPWRRSCSVGVQADAHVDAAVVEVQRVRMTLRAVADDGDLLRADEGEVCVLS